jgi:hypothetical protein
MSAAQDPVTAQTPSQLCQRAQRLRVVAGQDRVQIHVSLHFAHAVRRAQGYVVVRVVRVLRPDGRLLECRDQDPEDGVIEVFVVGGREQRRRRPRDARRRDRRPRERAEPAYRIISLKR